MQEADKSCKRDFLLTAPVQEFWDGKPEICLYNPLKL